MMTTSLFDWADEQGVVSLGIGAPDKLLLGACRTIMSEATKELLSSEETSYLQYGPRFGDINARQELAKFLSKQYKDTVDVENLMFNAGASHGLKFLAGSLMNVGDSVFVEDPTYFIAIRVMKGDLGLNVVPVPTDEGGIIVEELDKLMEESKICSRPVSKDKPFKSLVYLTPTYNNPTGSILGPERSTKLIQVLRKYKAMAICDDVYNTLHFDEAKTPPKRLFGFDNKADPDYQGNVFSNCTFSKILGPGLRVGWIEGPVCHLNLLANSGYACSGGCFNHYTACIMGKAMKLGLISKHLIYARKIYHSRMTALCDAIDKYIPSAKYLRPEGGYFVWVVLPSAVETQKVLDICSEKYKVMFHTGPKCSCVENFPNCLRLSFAYYAEEILDDAVKKIGLAIDEVLNRKA